MVALSDLPTLACVTMTAVNTAHKGKGSLTALAIARVNVAATVTRSASPSCNRRRPNQSSSNNPKSVPLTAVHPLPQSPAEAARLDAAANRVVPMAVAN
jgi:hypothetical protein